MIIDIKEYDFGMVEAIATSKRWGNGFRLQCDTKDQIPYAEKCLGISILCLPMWKNASQNTWSDIIKTWNHAVLMKSLKKWNQ